MAKPSKKKSYTEDVVLNKILKDIAEENLENTDTSPNEHTKQNTYEDDLIKQFREKDALELRQKYINIAKIIAVILVMIFLILTITNDNDTPQTKQTQIKKTVTSAPTSQPKTVKVTEPVQIETVKIEEKKTVPVKKEPKEVTPAPIKKPIKTEREIAKEMLLQQMKN